MALTGLDIFKKLPKTNCGDCGVPTCLAFAMKLAAGQAELASCPHVSAEAIAELSEAAAPPIRGITIGTGDAAFKIGEETVAFRHEKTFVNPPAVAVEIAADADEATIAATLARIAADDWERVGQRLRVGAVVVRGTGDAAAFAALAARVDAAGLAVVLAASSEAEARAGLEAVAASKPLLHAATEQTADAMIALAAEFEVPLAVRGEGLAAAAALAQRAMDGGVKDIVLDSAPTTGGAMLRDLVGARRAALKSKEPTVGFPAIVFALEAAGGDATIETAIASAAVAKYAGIVVLSTAEPEIVLPVVVLRQNIYTDPQRPMQVEPKIYEINNPGPDSPLIVTTNFSLTYFIVSGEIEASRQGAYLAIVESEGLSVLTAWAAGKFVPDRIAPFIKKTGIEERIAHREIVIPGCVAQISGELTDAMDGWNVVVGPVEAAELPAFLRRKAG